MVKISGITRGGVPVTAWVVRFVVNGVETRTYATGDTEQDAEAVVLNEYRSLGYYDVYILEVMSMKTRNQFMSQSIRTDPDKYARQKSRKAAKGQVSRVHA